MAAVPAIRTSTVVSPALRVRARERAEPNVNGLAATLAFTALTYAFFSLGSLAGSVLTEQARRESLAAVTQSRTDRSSLSILEKRLDGVTSLGAIDRWAAQNGFLASDRVLQTSLSHGHD